jgi:hypothetical protein
MLDCTMPTGLEAIPGVDLKTWVEKCSMARQFVPMVRIAWIFLLQEPTRQSGIYPGMDNNGDTDK